MLDQASGIALSGHTVQAVLAGRTAAVVQGRFPYGNAVLIETPLEELPSGEAEKLAFPTLAPTIQPLAALTCPTSEPPEWDFNRHSIYILYAHMKDPPELEVGEAVACGQEIGVVGESGNALNPHLHLEARMGPSGATFESMAHYDASASPEEMANYCTWRVRGVFQMFDPMQLLGRLP